MVRIFKILFLLILFPLSGWTQETETVFKGTVTNTNGKGIANVLCKALNTNDCYWLIVLPRTMGNIHCNTRRMQPN